MISIWDSFSITSSVAQSNISSNFSSRYCVPCSPGERWKMEVLWQARIKLLEFTRERHCSFARKAPSCTVCNCFLRHHLGEGLPVRQLHCAAKPVSRRPSAEGGRQSVRVILGRKAAISGSPKKSVYRKDNARRFVITQNLAISFLQ